MHAIAFLGTGNMGGALARAACRGTDPASVLLTNRTYSKAAALAEELGCTAVHSNCEAVAQARILMLGVKPQMMAGLLDEIKPVIKASLARGEEKIVVSMAAGLPISFYLSALDCPELPFLRIMPNTPAAVGQGMTLVSSCNATAEALDEFEALFHAAGRFDRISEAQMDAAGVVAGCTPAFACLFMEALADGGVRAGLTRRQAQEYAAQAVLGTAALLLESGKHPGVLKDEVCSPGGSTIAGVEMLEAGSFRYAAMEAVTAAVKRSMDLGKPKE